jgi:uncharacterized membrane protein
MVSAKTTDPSNPSTQLWVIAPARALSWPEAKRVLCLISLLPACSGLLFLWHGAPLVLPFAGIEIALLWIAFYYVIRDGEQREIVRIEGSQVWVEKGRFQPTEIHTFDLAWVRVELRRNPHSWYPNRLCLASHGREVVLGQFLTDGERIELAQSLINAIHKTR